MNRLRHFLRVLRRAPRWRLVAVAGLLLAGSLTDGVGFVLLVPLLSSLTGSELDNPVAREVLSALDRLHIPATTLGLLAIFVAIIAVRNVIQVLRDWVSLRLQLDVVDRLREECIRGMHAADWRWISRQRHSDYASLVIGEANRIGVGLKSAISLLTTLATALAYFGAAAVFSPVMAGLILAAGAIGFVAMRRIRHKATTLGSTQFESNRRLVADIEQGMGALKLSKALGNEDRQIARLMATIQRLRRVQLDFGLGNSLTRNLQQVIGAVLLAFYVYVGIEFLALPLAELIALTFLFSRLMPLMMTAQQMLHQWLNTEPALIAIETFLTESVAHAEPPAGAAPRPWKVGKAITLRDASVTFSGRQGPALDRISLNLPAGSTTAIVGRSGAGKSTLADTLIGLIEPDAGQLEVDGHPVTGPERRRWRQAVSYVPQEAFLFHDTIRANLLWGKPDASDDELTAALQKAAAGFVADLPHGLATMVGTNGIQLSGGERQRIALARALLARPSLLILDEATSALDTENERAIGAALRALHGEFVIVLIGHRLTSLEHADQVAVLEAGRIVACGRWEDVRHIAASVAR